MTDRCDIPRCHDDAAVTYLGHGVCTRHWSELTNETAPPDALRKALGIKSELQNTEDTHMASKKKIDAAPETKPQKPQPSGEPAPETAVAAKEVKSKTKKAPRPKPEKKPREQKPKEELCVFALRLTPAERDALHKTAGPARASRFARTILVAAANEDEAAFRTAIKEAREAR